MEVALVFTGGISLKQWAESGLLGREKLIYEKLLDKSQVDRVYWVTYGSEDERYRPEIKNLHVAQKPVKGHWVVYSLLAPFMQKNVFKRVDLVKTNQMLGSWTAVLASKLYNKPLIVRTGYTWSIFAKKEGYKNKLDYFSKLAEWFAYGSCAAAVVSSKADATYIINNYRIPKDKVFIIPNYIDTGIFKPDPTIEKYANKLVFVGRLKEQKNLDNLVMALRDLPYELDIFGTGELRERVESLANELGVKVNFMGSVDNQKLPNILNRYSVFVLPSLFEGMPKSLIEAMACGLAVLGTDVVGIREIIDHGHTGWLVNTDHESIREGILHLMKDDGLKKKLGEAAYQDAHRKYSLDAVVESELLVYKFALTGVKSESFLR